MATAEERRVAFEEIAKELGLKILWRAQIKPGDLYLGMRNAGPHLLTCKHVHEHGFVVNTVGHYAYDEHECVKVMKNEPVQPS
jgi:hypothetical protein